MRRCLFLGLSISQRAQYPVDIIEALCLAGAASQVVGWPTVEEGEVGNKQRVLDIGQGRESSDLGIWSLLASVAVLGKWGEHIPSVSRTSTMPDV